MPAEPGGRPPRIAIAVPNLNQGRFLDAALDSIRETAAPAVWAVLDAGSRDESLAIIERRSSELAFWRSRPDDGQPGAINEGIERLCQDHPSVEFVGFLNADDFYVNRGLDHLDQALTDHPEWAAVAGRAVVAAEDGSLAGDLPTEPFTRDRFALLCTICQPATLIRRSAWEQVGGVDGAWDMCFDYDFWWRLSHVGPIGSIDACVAASRDHGETKTRRRRLQYFQEAKAIVRRETGAVPWHWFISEALERQVGFEVGRRPGVAGRIRAAMDAGAAYWSDRRRASTP